MKMLKTILMDILMDTAVILGLAARLLWPENTYASYFTSAAVFFIGFLCVMMIPGICYPVHTGKSKEMRDLYIKRGKKGPWYDAYDMITDLICGGLLIMLGHYIMAVLYLFQKAVFVSKTKDAAKAENE